MQLQTNRLYIRGIELRDAKDYARIRNEEFVMKYNVLKKITEEDAREIIENDTGEAWALILKDEDSFMGVIFNHEDSLRYGTVTRELSFWLSEKH